VFGLEVRHDWNLIGKVYLFCDSLYSLLETINDEAPIITTTGENKGTLRYSIVPKIHEDGEEVSLLDFDDVNQLVGRTLDVKLELHGAKGLPDQLCTEVYGQYNWIDESAKLFTTAISPPGKKSKNVDWNYKHQHELHLNNYIVKNLSESVIIVSVFGKISEENMKDIVNDFAKRPETAALVSPDKFPNNIGEIFFDDQKRGKADIMIIEENEESIEQPYE